MIEKVVGVNGFDLEVPISEHMAFFTYVDRPGVVGSVGRVLGEAGTNIGGMQVARDDAGGQVLMVLTVDSKIPAAVLSEISQEIGAIAVVADIMGD
jgi:D-3-phosphoglycerate dehydrogenase